MCQEGREVSLGGKCPLFFLPLLHVKLPSCVEALTSRRVRREREEGSSSGVMRGVVPVQEGGAVGILNTFCGGGDVFPFFILTFTNEQFYGLFMFRWSFLVLFLFLLLRLKKKNGIKTSLRFFKSVCLRSHNSGVHWGNKMSAGSY